MLGVAAFSLIHTATPYGTDAAGRHTVVGTAFRCRLCALPRMGNTQPGSAERKELANLRLLMVEPEITLLADVQLRVVDEDAIDLGRWNLESAKLDPVYGPTGSIEYRRTHVIYVGPN